MRDLLRQKLQEALSSSPPPLTRRDVHLPAVPGKAVAVIGVRRSGKTSFLWQCLADRLAAGAPRESLLLLGFEDDRLEGLQASDLAWLLDEYYRLQPGLRRSGRATLFFDEIQLVSGWESFARRLMDTERADVFLSGSSARLLSREVSSSMRGRAMEALVHPFSFREFLRHEAAEPSAPWDRLPAADRSDLDHRLRRYLREGGFPESLGVPQRDRVALLRGYVDLVVLRDVIERHAVSNPLALRWLQRHLLASPAGLFSINRFHGALRSQGLAVSKDTLHAYLSYLEDSFLVRTVAMHAGSERQRMVNPRKAYPVDPGLIPLFEYSGRENLGHALETTVLLELERRGRDVAYVRTPEGHEVDFIATAPGREELLLQVSAELATPATWEREVRALAAAAAAHPRASAHLITLDATPPSPPLPAPLEWLPAASWLLSPDW